MAKIKVSTLLAYVSDFEAHVERNAFRGASHPDDRDEIEARYKASKKRLRSAIRSLEN